MREIFREIYIYIYISLQNGNSLSAALPLGRLPALRCNARDDTKYPYSNKAGQKFRCNGKRLLRMPDKPATRTMKLSQIFAEYVLILPRDNSHREMPASEWKLRVRARNVPRKKRLTENVSRLGSRREAISFLKYSPDARAFNYLGSSRYRIVTAADQAFIFIFVI